MSLDLHCEMILDEYRERRALHKRLQEVVTQTLHRIVEDNHLYVTAIESRIKTEKSRDNRRSEVLIWHDRAYQRRTN